MRQPEVKKMMSTQGFKERTRDLTQLGPSPSRVVRLRLGQATWDSTQLNQVGSSPNLGLRKIDAIFFNANPTTPAANS